MTIADRNQLLENSIAVDPDSQNSRRFTLRRGAGGLEIFDCKCHSVDGDVAEYHGHPATFVPTTVLRAWRDSKAISPSEYKVLRRGFGC
jgi:hypothetical protein